MYIIVDWQQLQTERLNMRRQWQNSVPWLCGPCFNFMMILGMSGLQDTKISGDDDPFVWKTTGKTCLKTRNNIWEKLVSLPIQTLVWQSEEHFGTKGFSITSIEMYKSKSRSGCIIPKRKYHNAVRKKTVSTKSLISLTSHHIKHYDIINIDLSVLCGLLWIE